MGNMERLWSFAVAQRSIVTIAGQAKIAIDGITPCTGIADWLTGCGSTIASLFANLILGTVAGAPAAANLVLGVYFNGLLVIAIFKWGRGVADL
jgi:hypothetical protein